MYAHARHRMHNFSLSEHIFDRLSLKTRSELRPADNKGMMAVMADVGSLPNVSGRIHAAPSTENYLMQVSVLHRLLRASVALPARVQVVEVTIPPRL